MRARIPLFGLALTVLIFVTLAARRPCCAVELFGQATTEVAWWQDVIDRDPKFSVYQYLRVGALDLVKDQNLSVFGYGRFGFNDAADPEDNGRLYYLYLDWKDAWKERMDLRVGRQWTNLVAASTIIDGAMVDFKTLGPVGVVLLGGRDIVFDEFGTISHSNSTAWGGEVYLRDVKDLDLSLSYAQTHDEGDLARQTAAYDFGYTFKGLARLYSEARYDVIGEKLGELVAGLQVFPSDAWTIRGEYFYSYPTFDATSIYAVFAASQFHAASFFVDYDVSDALAFYGGYTGELFYIEDATNSNANLFEVGTHVKIVEARVNGSIVYRDGYPGDLLGFSLAVDRPFLDDVIDLAAGINYDVYKRDEMIDDDVATKYWVGGRYYFSKNVSLALHVENTRSARQTYNFAGWSSLQVTF